MIKIIRAEFYKGAGSPRDLLGEGLFRIGFAGRSNVGKSTLLNRLMARKNLAKTSATPGRTKEFNVYRVEADRGTGDRELIELVDFPGFGYAKFSKAERKALRRKILSFVEAESALPLLCLLNDARRIPEEDELSLVDIAASAGTHVLIVATKTDKLRRNEVKQALARIAREYGLEPDDIVPAGNEVAIEKLWERLEVFL